MVSKFAPLLFLMLYIVLIYDLNYVIASNYKGESFPVKYLDVDDTIPHKTDLNTYLEALDIGVEYFYHAPNASDGNWAIGLYFTKVLLKRILLDYDRTLKDHHREKILNIIKMAEYTISNYIHKHKPYDIKDFEYRFSTIFQYDDAFVYSIREFNTNRLRPWLLNKSEINEYIEAMDKKLLPKEKYIELVDDIEGRYNTRLDDSDLCLSHLLYQLIPTDVTDLRQCSQDPECHNNLQKPPSVAYTLSHRFLNVMMLRNTRRCFLQSKEEDDEHLDMLCAQMYRETVYLARRGFFFRDLFLEHIALCAMLGYKEFHRPKWFYKALSWVKEEGCIVDTPNFKVNRTALLLRKTKSANEREKILKRLKREMAEHCNDHPSVLLLNVISHAIRYTVHLMNS